jgi:hypothetical protein
MSRRGRNPYWRRDLGSWSPGGGEMFSRRVESQRGQGKNRFGDLERPG